MKPFLLLVFSLFISTIAYSQVGKTFHVKTNTLNLRQEPSTSSQSIDKLNLNDNVLLKDSIINNWCKVSFNGKEGYVAKDYIAKGKAVVNTYEIRTGAVCNDGTSSTATGRGACSHHGGVAYWKTKTQKSIEIVED